MSIYHWLKQRNDGERHSEAPGGSVEVDALERQVIAALRTIYDPEIPVNIYDLGLVYELAISTAGTVRLRMTLTAPGCPVAHTFPGMVERAIRSVPGVTDAHVELVWDPPWSRERMSEAARLELGMM
ncbi:MAG: SUF system Fe-S cluster assembly protein [Betaproteobacteria bacterium]|nr:MAG: SUF system Fe-S cluster assembly protein [Betaproteobacteria bacterium]